MAKVIALSSNKGGVLKTSLAVNISGVLANQGSKVLLIDLDNQGNVATSFGLDPDRLEFSIYDLLTMGSSQTDINNPKQAVTNVADNLDMIAANDDMAYFEIDILTSKEFPDYFDLLKNALVPFENSYDFIVLDTPPQMGLIAANVFNAAEDIIIPFQPEQYAFRSLVKSMTAIDKFSKTNTKLKIKDIIPVKVKPRTLMHQAFLQSAKALAQSRNIEFSSLMIKDSIKYAELVARYNVPVTLLDSNEVSKELQGYQNVYMKIVKELNYEKENK